MIRFTLLLLLILVSSCARTDWRKADRSSAGIAPLPESVSEAIVHVYVARTINWRGYFAVHPWIATKERDANHYTIFQVVGWRARQGLPVMQIEKEIPDRKWFGAMPEVIQELRGEKAEKAIANIKLAAASYPYPNSYRAYPGPNSNTFISHIIRNTPQLQVELPPHAVGKDWIGAGDFFGYSESGTGVQFSLFGMLGATIGLGEGIEFNLLGLSFGIDILHPALKLPMIGRIGVKDGEVN